MGSSFLSEVHDASDQEGAPRSVTSYLLLPPLPQATLPRSGYRGSDLVHWPGTADFCDAAISSAIGGFADVTLSAKPPIADEIAASQKSAVPGQCTKSLPR